MSGVGAGGGLPAGPFIMDRASFSLPSVLSALTVECRVLDASLWVPSDVCNAHAQALHVHLVSLDLSATHHVIDWDLPPSPLHPLAPLLCDDPR